MPDPDTGQKQSDCLYSYDTFGFADYFPSNLKV